MGACDNTHTQKKPVSDVQAENKDNTMETVISPMGSNTLQMAPA